MSNSINEQTPGASEVLYKTFLSKLEEYIEKILKVKKKVIICVVGKNGSGKSYFGRYVRRNGIGRFSKNMIVVIDDRVATLGFLGFLKKKVKIPREGYDNLQPFLNSLPDKKNIVLYINNTPADKLTEADILLKLQTDEETRRRRLEKRYKNDPEKLNKYLDAPEASEYGIKYTYMLSEII